MKKTYKIHFFIIFLISVFAFTKAFAILSLTADNIKFLEDKGYILSDAYSTESLCNEEKAKNDLKFTDFNRTECFNKDINYYYFLCNKTINCDLSKILSNNGINSIYSNAIDNSISNSSSVAKVNGLIFTENPYKADLDEQTLIKLDKIISAFKEKRNTLTEEKYAELHNDFITKLNRLSVKYKTNNKITLVIKYLIFEIEKIKNNEGNVGEFLCDLIGNCSSSGSLSNSGNTNENTAICTTDYSPVCGVDGKTYSNICIAKSKDISINKFGECSSSGSTN